MKEIDYSLVKSNYPDSLSQYDFKADLINPKKQGTVTFEVIFDKFVTIYSKIYELEVSNYRYNASLKDKNRIDLSRDGLKEIYDDIRSFSTGSREHPSRVRDSIVLRFKKIKNDEEEFLDEVIVKLQTKFLISLMGQGDAINYFKEQRNLIHIQGEEIKRINKEASKYLSDIEKEFKNTDFDRIQSNERFKGSEGSAQYYADQSILHKSEAEKWLRMRGLYEKGIYIFIGITGFSYLVTLLISYDLISSHESFTPESIGQMWGYRTGLFIAALLGVLYVGLNFSTKNYRLERRMRNENESKANTARSASLFSSGLETDIKQEILRIAAEAIFSCGERLSTKERVRSTNIKFGTNNAELGQKIEEKE